MLNFKDLKYIFIDLDGTLTDGCYRVTDTGVVEKSFYSRDFYAIQQAQEAGLAVRIFTHSDDRVIDQKFHMLPDACKQDLEVIKVPMTTCKREALQEWFKENLVSPNVLVYIGDGENDLLAMEECAWTGCPADAAPILRERVNHCTDRPGGHGAVNEFIMNILAKREAE